MAVLLVEYGMAPWAAVAVVLLLGAAIGLAHGLLVTKLKLQAFVVTLCGMFIYRGAARWLTGDGVRGLGNQATYLADAGFDPTDIAGQVAATQSLQGFLWTDDVVGLPRVLVVFLVLAALAALFLHGTVFGRYFFALGSNERAARFSGIATDRYKILAYVLSALTAAFAGIINLMQINSAQPSTTGQSFELYAIAGAVLGGCSLRGGEGNILGILIGTAILRLLPNLTNMWGIPSLFEPVVVGVALLAGALVDEVLRPRGAAAK
jgi:ribose transport system permease protein